MTEARLVPTRVPDDPRGVVLVLHGGGARRDRMRVSPTQLSVLRMVPIAKDLARAGRGRLAVYRLLNSTRGWDTRHTPVHDARWALEQLAERHPDLPASLVGHSLGGRAALLGGGSEGVRSVVALNPWLAPDDRGDLSDRDVLVVHGTDDRVASPARAQQVATRLGSRARTFGFLWVRGGKHAMLGRSGDFTGAATAFVTATLLGDEPREPVRTILGGEREASV